MSSFLGPGGSNAIITINTTPIIGGTPTEVLYTTSGNTVGNAAALNIDGTGQPNVPTGFSYQHNNTIALFSVHAALGANWFIGQAGNFTVTGHTSMGMGSLALAALSTGNSDIAIGDNALLSLISGNDNIALGTSALASNQTGSSNVAVGAAALSASAAVAGVTAIGYQAGLNCTGTNNFSVAIGYDALLGGSDPGYNVAVGRFALGVINGGTPNVAIGADCAINLTTGGGNVILGSYDPAFTSACGATIVTANECIVIGGGADVPSSSANGQMSIGNFIYGTGLTGFGATISAGWVGIGKKAAFGSEAFGVVGGITVSGDPGGSASSNTLSGTSSTTISTGVGVIHMSTVNTATNSGWLKCYIGTQVAWIPCWTTNSP